MHVPFDLRAVIITAVIHFFLGILLFIMPAEQRSLHVVIQRTRVLHDTDVYFKKFVLPPTMRSSSSRVAPSSQTIATGNGRQVGNAIVPTVPKTPEKNNNLLNNKSKIASVKKNNTLKQQKTVTSDSTKNIETVTKKTQEQASKTVVSEQKQTSVHTQNNMETPVPVVASLHWNAQGINTDRLERAVRNVLYNRWHPPVDIPKRTCALVCMKLDAQAQVQECVFEKRSGRLLFDQSIPPAVLGAQFPAHLKNITISVEFTL